MIFRTLEMLRGTPREVRGNEDRWLSRRLLLAGDALGYSFHDTVVRAGSEQTLWYRHHVETVYCLEGEGELELLEDGSRYPVRPGTLYTLDGHEAHRFRARTDVRMICIFRPALEGAERLREDGSFPPPAGEAAGQREPARAGAGRRAQGARGPAVPPRPLERLEMDKEKFLAALLDNPSAHYEETPFEELSEAEQVLVTLRALDGCLNEGGFRRYFEEEAGDQASFAVEALEQVGAFNLARLVERALSVFGVDGVPVDQESRVAVLERLSVGSFQLLEELDAEYCEYPDDLTGLLYDFVIANKDAIHGID